MRNHVHNVALRIIQFLNSIHLANLRWLIDCFNIDSDAHGIVRVLTIVSIQPAHPLLEQALALPVANKSIELLKIHKTNVVHVAVDLAS